MNDVKISVIVPFYKTPQDGFDSCIESLISQTYHNLEILVIDDCSGYEWFKQLDDVAKLDPRITVCLLYTSCSRKGCDRRFFTV